MGVMRAAIKHACHSLQQFRSPLRDLIGMHVKRLRQFSQGPVAFEHRHRHFRLEGA